MPAFLRRTSGEEEERIPCTNIVTLGRDATNTIAIVDSMISRNHAMIRCLAEEQFYLFDSGSRNGCFVNDFRIKTPTLLKSGDVIKLGDTILNFEQFIVPRKRNQNNSEALAETMVAEDSTVESLTILVADIRGYSSLAEQLSIKTLSEMMAKWFDNVQRIVQQNGGRVDKFIGDCVMALWEIDKNAEQVAMNSLKTAYELFEYTKGLKKIIPELPNDIRIGVGINTGEAAVGIGRENTAMGDTVNTAFRLESATKTLVCDLVMSQSTYKLLPGKLWEGRERSIKVKGKSEKITVSTLNLSQNSEPKKE